MNLQLIKTLAERQRVPIKKLADLIGMSEGNLHRCVRENKIQAQELEKIAQELDVNIGVFFGEESSVHIEMHDNGQGAGRDIFNGSQRAEVQRLKDKIEHLEERLQDKQATIDEKDATIKEKERTIQILLGNLK